MMGSPVDYHYASTMLEAWGITNCAEGPRGYPKIAPFIPQARGKDVEWADHKVEIVGYIVQHLDPDDRVIVKLYFEPQSNGKRLKVNAIRKKTCIHSDKIHRAIDRCIGRVAAALSMPQYFHFENNT